MQNLSNENTLKSLQEINLGLLAVEYKSDEGAWMLKKLNRFGSLGRAGLVNGDVVLSMNGHAPRTAEEATQLIAQAGAGGTIVYRVRRSNQYFDLPVTMLKKRSMSFDLDELGTELENKIAPIVLACPADAVGIAGLEGTEGRLEA